MSCCSLMPYAGMAFPLHMEWTRQGKSLVSYVPPRKLTSQLPRRHITSGALVVGQLLTVQTAQ